jgi:hypothetical protein
LCPKPSADAARVKPPPATLWFPMLASDFFSSHGVSSIGIFIEFSPVDPQEKLAVF